MKITKETIEYVSELARLELSEEEKGKMLSEMENIIYLMDKLNQLDTSNVKPMEHVISIRNVLREDKVEKSFDREKILKNAPSHEKGYFKVPRIVE